VTGRGLLGIALFFALVTALAVPLGSYIARVVADESEGHRPWLERVLSPLEKLLYRILGVSRSSETDWKTYAVGMLLFNVAGIFLTYGILRAQALLPLNPQGLAAPSPDLAWNTAVSFVTNTNWQSYAGESTFGYFAQMTALAVQNFVCAASGLAVVVALIRGLVRRTSATVGCFWVDLIRGTLYLFLPLSLVLALLLVSQGVVQTFHGYPTVPFLQSVTGADGKSITDQVLAVGPAASQIAIKMVGTNGGGFFNANSAHPFENPTAFSNLLEMLALLLVPASLCFTFGTMVKDKRQGWAIFAAMSAILVPLLIVCVAAEQAGNPALAGIPGIDQAASALQAGGNMEGKEVRFGIASSGLFATITTAVSCGAVNAMHDSLTPLGGLVPMWLIQLGEVVFGGVGAGLYGMLMFAIVAVFVAGLMVGRTPEYLGKKIEAYEMKMASLVVLVPPATVLVGTAIAVMCEAGRKGILNPGAHGFSEILYAYSSAANNNGSAFGGLSANTPFYNVSLGVAMFLGRFFVKIPVLALAGALARKKFVPVGAGTLPTHTPLFVSMLVGVVILVGALTFIPALALGPIVEQLLAHAPPTS
jgi:K+-transporting ATPase ATPase A chain